MIACGALIGYAQPHASITQTLESQSDPILVQKTAGYSLASAALGGKNCLLFLGFQSTLDARYALQQVEFFYSSKPADPWTVAITDFRRIWLYPLYFAPQSRRFKMPDGVTLNGLQLWDRYFEIQDFVFLDTTISGNGPHSRICSPSWGCPSGFSECACKSPKLDNHVRVLLSDLGPGHGHRPPKIGRGRKAQDKSPGVARWALGNGGFQNSPFLVCFKHAPLYDCESRSASRFANSRVQTVHVSERRSPIRSITRNR